MKKQERIEQLQREIQILKEAIVDTTNASIEKIYAEDIDNKEQEIIKILDGDIIVDEAEYQEEAQQRQDELEASRGQY